MSLVALCAADVIGNDDGDVHFTLKACVGLLSCGTAYFVFKTSNGPTSTWKLQFRHTLCAMAQMEKTITDYCDAVPCASSKKKKIRSENIQYSDMHTNEMGTNVQTFRGSRRRNCTLLQCYKMWLFSFVFVSILYLFICSFSNLHSIPFASSKYHQI